VVEKSDLLAKVDALAQGSQLAKRKEQASKREVWQRIQQKSPDTAAALTQVSEFFGKPEELAVKFDGEDWIKVR